MRNLATIILAAHLGKVLTPELASEMLEQFPAHGTPIDLDQFQPRTCGSIVFAAERLLDILDEIEPLHEAHWMETEHHYQGTVKKPDIGAGLADEQAGRMIQFTARHEGRLVGNMRMYVGGTSRHTGRPMATEDTIFLLPEFRGGIRAVRFMQYVEDCLAQLHEETEVYMDDKLANPSGGRVLEFLGYKHIANRRYKILTRGKNHVRS